MSDLKSYLPCTLSADLAIDFLSIKKGLFLTRLVFAQSLSDSTIIVTVAILAIRAD